MTSFYPSLYEVNTRVFLTSLSEALGRPAFLADVPDAELDRLAEKGFDWVWLLGIWQTGSAGPTLARSNPHWRREWQKMLPDLDESDICGSCFAITGYTVHERLGGKAPLADLRERLHRRGLRLMLDFIPNHTALDHPWAEERPDFYVRRGSGRMAHGRDPNFPEWPDTLQLDYGNPALQEAMIGELLKVAGMCDGARCDMAMLILPEVFERTWGIAAKPFWPGAIDRVREDFPDFLFLAEVYWDLEWALQQQGFDYAYDKRLYDRLRDGSARSVREHLRAGRDFQSRLARFMENHDEPRAASLFAPGKHRAAALVTFLSPGLRLFHQGQLEGFKKHVPGELCRGPLEPTDPELGRFYEALLRVLKGRTVREGKWQLLEPVPAWEGNSTWDKFIAFAWHSAEGERIWVTVNYAPHRGQCYIRLPSPDFGGRKWRLTDLLGPARFEREGSELLSSGLYLDLPEWGHHVFDVRLGG